MGQPAIDVHYLGTNGRTMRAAPVVMVNRLGFAVSKTIVRPNNVTAYAAKDLIGAADLVTIANAGAAVFEFQDIGLAGGSIVLTGTDLRIDRPDIPAGMGSYTAHFFDSAPAALLDNQPFAMTADGAKYLGSQDLGAPAVVGGALFVQKDALAKTLKLAAGSTSLFVMLVTESGYTPGAQTPYTLRLQSRNA